MIVSQPLNVISELLPAYQSVEQVRDHKHRYDKTEEVGAAHVRDEEAEDRLDAPTLSFPSLSISRIAKTAIPITIATTSMRSICNRSRHDRMTIGAANI